MKVEQDLRIVIKAAADNSKKNSNHYEVMRIRREAIAKFMRDNTEKRMRINKLLADRKAAKKRIYDCEAKLEKEFGLDVDYRGELEINVDDKFRKAGGKLPAKDTAFSAEQVISEYAAAKTAQDGAKVLTQYGIVWK